MTMCSVFDNEEVGSGTKQGAGSTFGAGAIILPSSADSLRAYLARSRF
nr:hypothetical protein [uncultured Agathobaculum sp.]